MKDHFAVFWSSHSQYLLKEMVVDFLEHGKITIEENSDNGTKKIFWSALVTFWGTSNLGFLTKGSLMTQTNGYLEE